MIEITMVSDSHKVSLNARGHALFAIRGQDLVCCAVSTLLQAWLVSTQELAQIELSQERTEDTLQVEYFSNRDSMLLLKSLILNLGILQKQYPENVKVNLEEIHGT